MSQQQRENYQTLKKVVNAVVGKNVLSNILKLLGLRKKPESLADDKRKPVLGGRGVGYGIAQYDQYPELRTAQALLCWPMADEAEYGWGAPFDVNPPLGTPISTPREPIDRPFTAIYYDKDASSIATLRDIDSWNSGPFMWTDGVVVISWKHRYDELYYNGTKVIDTSDPVGLTGTIAAAIARIGGDYILRVYDYVHSSATEQRIKQFRVDITVEEITIEQQLADINITNALPNDPTGYLDFGGDGQLVVFSENGLKFAMMCEYVGGSIPHSGAYEASIPNVSVSDITLTELHTDMIVSSVWEDESNYTVVIKVPVNVFYGGNNRVDMFSQIELGHSRNSTSEVNTVSHTFPEEFTSFYGYVMDAGTCSEYGKAGNCGALGEYLETLPEHMWVRGIRWEINQSWVLKETFSIEVNNSVIYSKNRDIFNSYAKQYQENIDEAGCYELKEREMSFCGWCDLYYSPEGLSHSTEHSICDGICTYELYCTPEQLENPRIWCLTMEDILGISPPSYTRITETKFYKRFFKSSAAFNGDNRLSLIDKSGVMSGDYEFTEEERAAKIDINEYQGITTVLETGGRCDPMTAEDVLILMTGGLNLYNAGFLTEEEAQEYAFNTAVNINDRENIDAFIYNKTFFDDDNEYRLFSGRLDSGFNYMETRGIFVYSPELDIPGLLSISGKDGLGVTIWGYGNNSAPRVGKWAIEPVS